MAKNYVQQICLKSEYQKLLKNRGELKSRRKVRNKKMNEEEKNYL